MAEGRTTTTGVTPRPTRAKAFRSWTPTTPTDKRRREGNAWQETTEEAGFSHSPDAEAITIPPGMNLFDEYGNSLGELGEIENHSPRNTEDEPAGGANDTTPGAGMRNRF